MAGAVVFVVVVVVVAAVVVVVLCVCSFLKVSLGNTACTA
jgi:hypothetical protein